MDHYIYDGPVKEFDRIVNPNWHGETMAISESKAKNNLAYQYKKQNGKTARTKITLPAKVYLGG